MAIVSNILMLLAGLGVFLLGMNLISTNLQKVTGDKVGRMIARISNHKLAGIGVGAGAAVLLESSTATTVILVGLVNAGIINLIQATLIIMGANIGTTFTVILFSFGFLPIGEIFSFMSIVGLSIILSAQKERTKTIGWTIAGFGLVFVGLDVMTDGVAFLKDSAAVIRLFSSLDNPFLLVLIGALFTAVVQSGSAITGIVITLSASHIMPLTSACYIILGSNIGTCMTAIIASLGQNLNAKRTALIHLIFNVIGVILFMPFMIIWGNDVATIVSRSLSPAALIAYFHVVFNIISTVLMIPFVKKITELAIIILPDKMSAQITKK